MEEEGGKGKGREKAEAISPLEESLAPRPPRRVRQQERRSMSAPAVGLEAGEGGRRDEEVVGGGSGGAGVLCFNVTREGKVEYLLQVPLAGRKAATLVDLGGSLHPGETPAAAAMREFYEEGGKHLCSWLDVQRYFYASQTWSSRLRVHRAKRNWTLFLMRVPRFDLAAANRAAAGENRKRREFYWISQASFLQALKDSPETAPNSPRLSIPGQVPTVCWVRLAKMKKKLQKVIKLTSKYAKVMGAFEGEGDEGKDGKADDSMEAGGK